MRKLILAGIISASLIITSVMPAMAEGTVTPTTGGTTSGTTVTPTTGGTTGTTTTQDPVKKEKKVTEKVFVEQKVIGGYEKVDKAGVDALKAAGVKSVERIAFFMELSTLTKKTPAELAKAFKENEEIEAIAKALGITDIEAFKKQIKDAKVAAKAKIEAAKKEFKKLEAEKRAAEKAKKEKERADRKAALDAKKADREKARETDKAEKVKGKAK